jgi:hypothetical protein
VLNKQNTCAEMTSVLIGGARKRLQSESGDICRSSTGRKWQLLLCGTLHELFPPNAANGIVFAGGFILDGPWGRVASVNITPDESGIAAFDETRFTQVMRIGYDKARKLSQIMPSNDYRGMTEEDMSGVFAYIKTLKPVAHHVDNTLPPTYCKLCRQMHGGGNQN